MVTLTKKRKKKEESELGVWDKIKRRKPRVYKQAARDQL